MDSAATRVVPTVPNMIITIGSRIIEMTMAEVGALVLARVVPEPVPLPEPKESNCSLVSGSIGISRRLIRLATK